jgi:hypothetical protein
MNGNLRITLGFIFIMIGIMIFIAIPTHKNEDKPFYISGFGAVLSQYPSEKETFSYSITLENPGKKAYKIHSIEPIIPENFKNLILSSDIMTNTQKALQKGKKIEIKGELLINTSQMTEEEISKLSPMIKSCKIIFDNNKEIILNTGLI